MGLVCIGRVAHGVLLLKSIVEYCETLLNFMQIMPHWILRLGVGTVEEDGEGMIKKIYVFMNLYCILSKKQNIPYQDREVLSSSSALLGQLADSFETSKKSFWKQLTRG